MRLGVYVDQWRLSGVSTFAEILLRGLTVRGHECTLLLGSLPRRRDTAMVDALRGLARDCGAHTVDLRVPLIRRTGAWSRTADRVRSLGLDGLVLSSYQTALPLFERVARRVPLVSVTHNDHPDGYFREFLSLIAGVHSHVGSSRRIVETCRRFAPQGMAAKVRLIHYGVEVSKGPIHTEREGALKVVYSGRLDHVQKRVSDLAATWEKYLELGGGGHLTICGSGPAEAWLKRWLTETDHGSRVTLTGRLERGELLQVLQSQDVLLSVSNYEGLPLSVLEGAMAGLYPILSHTNSGHAEIVEKLGEGRLCAVGDTDGFASALIGVESDKEHVRALASAIRSRGAEHFGADRMVDSYEELLAEACQSPRETAFSRRLPSVQREDEDRGLRARWIGGLTAAIRYAKYRLLVARVSARSPGS